jgi:hypothetical protein
MFIRILKCGILSVSVLLMLFAYDVSAGKTSEDTKIEELIDRFGLQRIETIPEDVEPLYFNTVDELEDYLINSPNFQKINCEIQENHFEYSDYRIPDDFSILTTCGMVTRNCTAQAYFATFNTWGDFWVCYEGSFRWIDSVLNTRVGLTGYSVGLSLTDTYSYSYNQTTTIVCVKGGGIVNEYICVLGNCFIWRSQPVSCSFCYSVY